MVNSWRECKGSRGRDEQEGGSKKRCIEKLDKSFDGNML